MGCITIVYNYFHSYLDLLNYWQEDSALERHLCGPLISYLNCINNNEDDNNNNNNNNNNNKSRGPKLKSQSRKKEKFSQVQPEQYQHQYLCTKVKYLKLSDAPSLCSGSNMEIPLRAKPTNYMNIYDGKNKTKPKEIAQHLYQGVCLLVRNHAREW